MIRWILVAVTITGFWWLWPRVRKIPKFVGTGQPADMTALRKLVPHYIVEDGAFQIDEKKQIWRINSDGTRHYYDWWRLDENTGEFLRLKKQKGGHSIVETAPYNKRVVEYVQINETKDALKLGALAAILAFITFVLFAAVLKGQEYNPDFPQATDPWPIAFVAGAVCGLGAIYFGRGALLYLNKDVMRALATGPEPLKRKSENFGPPVENTSINQSSVGSSRATNEPDADLSYRPTT